MAASSAHPVAPPPPAQAVVCPIAGHGPARLVLSISSPGGIESSWGVRTDDALIYECGRCGLRFRKPPSRDEIEAYYGASYHDKMVGGEQDQHRESVHRLENEDRIQYLRRFRSGGKVLDIGCSVGHFASQLRAAGFDAHGSDISAYACGKAAETLGADRVFAGPVESFAERLEQTLDVVTMMDVIEHFGDVNGPLTAIRRILKPGGILFLRTPTLSSPFHRVAEWSHKLSGGRYKDAMLKLYHAEHLFFFDEKSIRALLESLGYEVVAVDPDPLLWNNFRSAEMRQGPVVNAALATIWAAGKMLSLGHGMKVIARRPAG
jgi:2-polyprenyl-3-methyl-5-hydroxy-6-metoxy-1,4-benzoquinol methylase